MKPPAGLKDLISKIKDCQATLSSAYLKILNKEYGLEHGLADSSVLIRRLKNLIPILLVTARLKTIIFSLLKKGLKMTFGLAVLNMA